ncbi:MAG: 1-phosphofructokinase family hexose kinase [Mucilaginibacter sp.]
MAAIITVTFNPALDKSTSVIELIPDKKLKCAPPVCEPGGGGINVARAIKKLGGDAVAIYLAGGYVGKMITELLTKELVESIVIETKESTRDNLVVADIANSKQYLFDMPGPNVSEQEWQACLNTIEQTADVKYIVASGSLPQGVPTDIFARISLIAKKKNARLIVDTAGEALKLAVQAGVFLIKPNLRELASLAGREELDAGSVVDAAREVMKQGSCEAVVVSMGGHGAMLVTKELATRIVPPELEAKSTVGAGDSMVAGIVLGLAANKTPVEAVQYGVACGSAATMSAGTELCRKEDAERLYGIIKTQTSIKV